MSVYAPASTHNANSRGRHNDLLHQPNNSGRFRCCAREDDIRLTLWQGIPSDTDGMTEPPISYKRHRFPPQIIAHTVWLYFRFPLSLRLVEELLLERGIVVSYETVRVWAQKFGPDYARRLKRKKPSRLDIWHHDEVVITINGEKRYLWRAVDQDGYPKG